jgi:hypothetical protein
MEYWSVAISEPNIPTLHYCNTPIFVTPMFQRARLFHRLAYRVVLPFLSNVKTS